MVNLMPEVSDYAHFSLQESANLLGVCVRTLRNKEKEGLLVFRYRRDNNRPFLSGRDIKTFYRKMFL